MRSLAGGVVAVVLAFDVLAWVALDSQPATVTIHAPLRNVAAYTTLTGSRESGQIPTRYVTANVTESVTGVSSRVTVSTFATGYVVFVSTNACTRECYGQFVLPVGYDVSTAAGVHYATQAVAAFSLIGSSRAIPIKAVVPGASGNAAAGTVSVVANPELVVSNPQPVTGGSDRLAEVVQQKDYDSTLADLSRNVGSEVDQVIRVEAPGMLFVAAGNPEMSVTSNHAVGDETPTFTLTETASVAFNAYSDLRVRQLLRANLASTLPRSSELEPWSVTTYYSLTRMSEAGELTIVGVANGEATPPVDSWILRELIAGKSPDQAAGIIHTWMPGSTVKVRGWLPSNPARIRIVIEASL